jgi:hypothetical protein
MDLSADAPSSPSEPTAPAESPTKKPLYVDGPAEHWSYREPEIKGLGLEQHAIPFDPDLSSQDTQHQLLKAATACLPPAMREQLFREITEERRIKSSSLGEAKPKFTPDLSTHHPARKKRRERIGMIRARDTHLTVPSNSSPPTTE